MARQRNSHRHHGAGVVIPGIYERLCATTYRGLDPRVYVAPDGQHEAVQAALSVRSPLLDALDANEPVEVPKWRVSNRELRQQFPWLAGVGSVVVFPDDTVEPVAD